MLRRLPGILLFVVLTLVTQVGGAAFALVWLLGRSVSRERLGGWRRMRVNLGLFVACYAALHVFVVPPLAALGGRVPLPCTAEAGRPFAAAHPLYCWLDRHYVDPRVLTVMTELSRAVERAHPGSVTLFLDANFPFLNGFPLLPHLSHHDGRKLDIAYFYAEAGVYRPGLLRSPIGYWAFEQPIPIGPRCPGRWLTLRWDMEFLQDIWRWP